MMVQFVAKLNCGLWSWEMINFSNRIQSNEVIKIPHRIEKMLLVQPVSRPASGLQPATDHRKLGLMYKFKTCI